MPILEVTEDQNPFLIEKPKKDFEQLTQEEKTALLDQLSSQADPEAFERLAAHFLNQATKQDFNTVNVQPQPGFVCKTRVIQSKQYAVNTVVYINICYASAIPAPPLTDEKEIQKALNADPNSNYKVPLSMGQLRYDEKNALVMDACVHTQPYLRSEKDLDFRLYILELAMEYVEDLLSVSLSREFTMPNTKCIGKIPTRVLRLPKPSLLSSVMSKPKQPYTMFVESEFLTIVIPMPDTVNIPNKHA
ncbi:pre-RNA processing PIH1/Nop17-domain-containing protein [Gilbertella persicaria]|uniref:pre-RNA processing PIH1/Nop17-domain-containing protein n=1 Tax=Gilbertella persicaria TaxID=101096 RepID=UPI00221FD40F|nr:pre-RNA processing PIH1/Nop17-domain-containing protein [Gilbertella persicaria]KAI8084017.1 pre-RNA processing PIH1/Nop17-domain-containing protein [Gilbertella persicaria]